LNSRGLKYLSILISYCIIAASCGTNIFNKSKCNAVRDNEGKWVVVNDSIIKIIGEDFFDDAISKIEFSVVQKSDKPFTIKWIDAKIVNMNNGDTLMPIEVEIATTNLSSLNENVDTICSSFAGINKKYLLLNNMSIQKDFLFNYKINKRTSYSILQELMVLIKIGISYDDVTAIQYRHNLLFKKELNSRYWKVEEMN
jgi:hypothetical protein